MKGFDYKTQISNDQPTNEPHNPSWKNSCCSCTTAYPIFLMVMKYSCSPSLADFRLHPHSSAKQRLLLPAHQLLVTGMLVGEIYDMQVK